MYSTTNAYSTNPYSTNPYDPSESPNSENNYESNIVYCECSNRKILFLKDFLATMSDPTVLARAEQQLLRQGLILVKAANLVIRALFKKSIIKVICSREADTTS